MPEKPYSWVVCVLDVLDSFKLISKIEEKKIKRRHEIKKRKKVGKSSKAKQTTYWKKSACGADKQNEKSRWLKLEFS